MRDRVIRRDPSRPPLLDVDIDSPRFSYKLEEKWYEKFFALYPCARTVTMLALELGAFSGAVSRDQDRGWIERLARHSPSSSEFQAIAHWSRLERAHRDSEARGQSSDASVRDDPQFHGLTLPAREPMPDALRDVLGVAREKKRRSGKSAPARTG